MNQAYDLELKFNYENQSEDPTIALCTYFVKKDHNNEGMFDFINQVMSRENIVLFGSLPPRIPNELHIHLQLSLGTITYDWFLFEIHRTIKVYSFEDEPFLLPSFLTPRIYAPEYIRKRFGSYDEIFTKYHNPITFKIPYTIGPFLAESKETRETENDLLKHMRFHLREKMHYDPYHLISEK